MDEKYFDKLLLELKEHIGVELSGMLYASWVSESAIPTLKRIYLDGCKAQADKSRIAFYECNPDISVAQFVNIESALAAAEIREAK